MTPKPDNLPAPADMDLPTLLRECARVLHNAGGADRGAGYSAQLAEAALRLADAAPGWQPIETAKKLPEKPGLRNYEYVECLIFVKGGWEVGQWNCEHLCWDDDERDDFRYHPTVPTHWMPMPPAPEAAE